MAAMKRWWTTLILFLPAAATLAVEAPTPEVMQSLRAGEVVVRSINEDDAAGAARVMALFQSPAEDLWNVLLSCEQAFLYVKGMTACEVLESDGPISRVQHVVKRPWPLSPLDIVFEAKYDPYSTIDFRLLDGNMDRFEGQWRFSETEHGLLLDYEVHIKPRVPAPRFLIRHSIRRQLPNLIACLRALSNGSGSPEQQATDQARCPKPRP